MQYMAAPAHLDPHCPHKRERRPEKTKEAKIQYHQLMLYVRHLYRPRVSSHMESRIMFVGKKDHFHMLPLVGRIASPLSFVPKIPVDTLADPSNPKGFKKRPK